MKRIEKGLDLKKKIAPISLFLDDLEYIFELAKKNDHKIDISDQEFTFDGIDELNKVRGKKVTYLKIKIEEPHWNSVYLDYKKGTVDMHSWGATDKQRLIFLDILERLQKNRPIILTILGHTSWPAFFLCCFVGIPILTRHPWVIVTYFSLFFLFGGGWLTNLFVKRFAAGIYLQRRHDVESFWKRNADRIILLLLGAAIGGAIKWAFDVLSKLHTK